MKPDKRMTAKLFDAALRLPDDVEDYSYEDGIRLTRFAISVAPREPFLYFYLAVFHSAMNRVPKSLFYYEQALKRGYRDWHQIENDPSFENSRKTEKFRVITAKYRNGSPGSFST